MSATDLETARRMIHQMAALQDAHNREVAPDWRTRGFAYYRAVWVECAELLDHFGWKWWKRQQPEMEQVRLELVDIWHFGLSMLMRDDELDDGLVARVRERCGRERDAASFRTDVETLAASALTDRRFDVDAFVDCMNALGMSLEALYRGYVGKNVLNNFRQHHGYADGRYRKSWAGREDNVHLVELAAELDAGTADFAERLYAALTQRYRETEPAG